MNSSRLLAVVAVLQGLILFGQWSQGGGTPAHAADAPAAFGDAAGQRVQMIEELKTMNGKMDKLIGLLESGKLQVQVAQPDEKK